MRWPLRGDRGIEENLQNGLPLGGYEGETARSEFILWPTMSWTKRRDEKKRIHFMAYHEVAMKGRQRNRGEFTSWPTMRWPLRGD